MLLGTKGRASYTAGVHRVNSAYSERTSQWKNGCTVSSRFRCCKEREMIPRERHHNFLRNVRMEQHSSEVPPEEQDQLKWRADAKDSFSDWTIEIISSGQDGESGEVEGYIVSQTYHVHKYILAFGARRSDYFVKLFKTAENYNESNTNTSRIELNPIAAKAFPNLLDYLYSPHEPLKADTETATALCSLGEYFQISPLRIDAVEFCKVDMSVENVHIYYEHCRALKDDKVGSLVATFLARNIENISKSSQIANVSDCNVWVEVLQSYDQKDSVHMSDLLAEHGTKNAHMLSPEMFCQLTAADKLPYVSHNAALLLMEIADNVSTDGIPGEMAERYHDNALNLQERCSAAMSKEWKTINQCDETTKELLSKRKSGFLSSLLARTIHHASVELNNCQTSLQCSRHRVTTLERQLKDAEKQLEDWKQKASFKNQRYRPVLKKSLALRPFVLKKKKPLVLTKPLVSPVLKPFGFKKVPKHWRLNSSNHLLRK